MAYYQSKSWRGEWWGDQGFPLILIVTPRVQEITLMVELLKAGEFFRVIEKPAGIMRALRGASA